MAGIYAGRPLPQDVCKLTLKACTHLWLLPPVVCGVQKAGILHTRSHLNYVPCANMGVFAHGTWLIGYGTKQAEQPLG